MGMKAPKKLINEIASFVCECEILSTAPESSIFICLEKEYSFIEEREKNKFFISSTAWGILQDRFFFKSSGGINSTQAQQHLLYRDMLIEDRRGLVSYIHTPELISV
jgi:hypothetical protein